MVLLRKPKGATKEWYDGYVAGFRKGRRLGIKWAIREALKVIKAEGQPK
jgi:hypothetical protein